MVGTLMALHSRTTSGRGQVVDVSIYESVLALTEALVSDYAVAGVVHERSGAVLPGIAPSNVYETNDGHMLLIAANQDSVFQRLARAMGELELAEDERYAAHQARGARQAELDARVGEWTRSLSAARVGEVLDEHGVPYGRIYGAQDMLADQHFQQRRSIVEVDDAVLGSVPKQAVAPRLSATPGGIRWGGGAHGQHDDEVREWLASVNARAAEASSR